MTQIATLLTVLTFSISSCGFVKRDLKKTTIEQEKISKTTGEQEPVEMLVDPEPNQRFKESEIIAPTFDPNLLFGVWTISEDAPACEFEIDKRRLLLCDYDGDGERLYKIKKDSIFLDNPTLIFRGRILSVSRDSLVIHWQENDEPEVLLRWRD